MRARGHPAVTPERGAGSALAVAVVGALAAALVLAAAVAGVLIAHARVRTAADAAALAGADAALGNATGVPCERAAESAALAGVVVDRCAQRGPLVRVRVSVVVLGVPLAAEALAGPPPAG